MTHNHAYDVNNDGIAKEEREAQEHPGQVRRLEVDQAKEVEPEVRVASAPNVHQHRGEGMPQEELIYKHPYHNHERSAKKEHVEKVCCPAPERSFLEHPTVPDGEQHVEEEGKAQSAKEEEGGYQPPYLIVFYYQGRVEIKLEWRNDV